MYGQASYYGRDVPVWLRALAGLDEEGPATRWVLANRISVSFSGLDNPLRRMREGGLVERTEARSDSGRLVHLWSITPAGRDAIRETLAAWSAFIRGDDDEPEAPHA